LDHIVSTTRKDGKENIQYLADMQS